MSNRPKWSTQTKLVVSLLLLALGILLLFRFSVVVPALVLAAIVAYVLSPLVNLLQPRLRLPRGLATALVYVLLLGVVFTLPVVLFKPLTAQFAGLNLDLQRLLSEAEKLLGHEFTLAGRTIDGAVILQQIEGSLRDLIEPVFGHTLGFAVEVISSLVWVVFIVVVSFYLIKDSSALRDWVDSLVPPAYREDFIRLRLEIGRIWAAFFRGQLILAFVVSTLISIVGLIIGLPFALAMGAAAGLFEFLPSIGHGIWLTIASLLSLFLGSTWLPLPNWAFMLLVIGLHIVFQQFDLNYLIPRIIGRSVHLPPLVVILGIVVGASIAGVLGIVLAAPTISSARVIFRYIYANLTDQDPFPKSEAQPLPLPESRWWQRVRLGRGSRSEKKPEQK
ncbi:MAG: AI-2E family transporter [Chloroflexota bacterium]